MCVFDVGSRWDLANENVTCQDLGCARLAQYDHRENDTLKLAIGPDIQQRLRRLVARRGAQPKLGHPQGGDRQPAADARWPLRIHIHHCIYINNNNNNNYNYGDGDRDGYRDGDRHGHRDGD